MLNGARSRRELFAGGVILLFGLVSLLEGQRLGVGSLTDMGAGFVPMALGIVLCGLAPMIALAPQSDFLPDDLASARMDRRGVACILLGAIGFIVLGDYAGLIPATFGSVFVAAMGDRTTRVRSALALAAGVTVFGTLLFGSILKIPIPLIVGWNL